MISKLSHVSIYVLNQDSAYDFYVNKLGLKVHRRPAWQRALAYSYYALPTRT